MKIAARLALCLATLGAAAFAAPFAANAAEPVFHHAIGIIEPPKYPADFKHFDYVNVDAPKAGTLRQAQTGTFDTLNPVLDKGNLEASLTPRLSLVTETLLKPSMDEKDAVYGLLAESLSYPDDYSTVTFRLRAGAKWADGEPVTPEDVIFSFERFKDLNIKYANYYAHVVKAEKTGDRDVTFTSDETGNSELPMILGEIDIVPKHWWTATGADGKPRDISKTTLEPIMGSGPYKIVEVHPGSSITYALRDDYWGKDLNVNIGYNNFKSVVNRYYADPDVEFEAFRAGNVDHRVENAAMRWERSYDFPAVQSGEVKREVVENDYRTSGIMVGFIPNMRQEKFQDVRVRQALNQAFDFEELNRTIFFNQYKRVNSFYYGSELASDDKAPAGRELDILKSLKSPVPQEVFETPYANPVGGTPQKLRQNLTEAVRLFKEAGYEIRGGKMVNIKSGQPFTFEILLSGPTIERVALPFAANLRKIGVEANVRTVDSSQYINRVRDYDYDMIYLGWAESLRPGNEQYDFFGSRSADVKGGKNYAGIKNPAIDELIRQIIFAPDRPTLIDTVHAMDRILLAEQYVIPSYTARITRMAYRKELHHPDPLPEYSSGFPDIWWYAPEK